MCRRVSDIHTPSKDVSHSFRITVPDLSIAIDSAYIVTIENKIVSHERQGECLILKSWNVPRVVGPIIDVVRVLDEAVKVYRAITQGQVEDLVEVTIGRRSAFCELTDNLLDRIRERNHPVFPALIDGADEVVRIILRTSESMKGAIMCRTASAAILILQYSPVELAAVDITVGRYGRDDR